MTGADRAFHGVVRWRRIDLKRVVFECFAVDCSEKTVGKIPKAIGLSIPAENRPGWTG